MDARYGRGMWRPLPLFVVTQSSGKQRLIADGKRGQHNQHITEEETLFIISADFASHAARTILEAMLDVAGHEDHGGPVDTVAAALPECTQRTLGLEDMKDAFRQVPPEPGHERVNVVAWFSP